MTASKPKTWLITGISTGLGRALAEEALAAGHRVVGTVRDAAAIGPFETLAPGSGRQPGDPAKAGRAIMQLTEAASPPAHLLLGPDAVQLVREKLDRLQQEITAWEAVSSSTDFSPAVVSS